MGSRGHGKNKMRKVLCAINNRTLLTLIRIVCKLTASCLYQLKKIFPHCLQLSLYNRAIEEGKGADLAVHGFVKPSQLFFSIICAMKVIRTK